MNSAELKTGQVVTLDGKVRRYVVAFISKHGDCNLVALSGAVPGSAPSSINPERLTLDSDQSVTFSGAKAQYLSNKVDAYRRNWAPGSFGGEVIS